MRIFLFSPIGYRAIACLTGWAMALCLPFAAMAQETYPCVDVVRLVSGHVFRGKIIKYQPSDSLHMETFGGAVLHIPDSKIQHIAQRCRKQRVRGAAPPKPYNFRERGLYNATRAAALVAADDLDFSLQHSTGYQFNRWVGLGLGIGVENLSYRDLETVPTYPVFLEIRGYLSAQNLSPFYAVGGGWAFKGSEPDEETSGWWAVRDTWKAGWLAQAQVGYRIGNHITAHIGVRLQHKSRTWQRNDNTTGLDLMLHKRMEIGVGILL